MPIARGHGSKIAYDVTGDGPVLLLHPGMFQAGAHWTRSGYTSRLAATHTVVTVDPLGLGSSDAPLDSNSYTMQRRADSVVAVLDDLGADDAAMWGYSLGALTGFAVAIHAPHRLNRLIAGAFDPTDGFQSAMRLMREHLNLRSADEVYSFMEQSAATDPEQAAVINSADPAALRANFAAFSGERGVRHELAESPVRLLMYAGTADIWHDPIKAYCASTGTPFFAIPGCDHVAAWGRATTVLPQVMPFLDG